jgi:bifunctional non-homologous end joining protein LigD
MSLARYVEKRKLASTPEPKGPARPRKPRLPRLNNLPSEEPAFVKPMAALLVDKIPAGQNWLAEIKWDGYRALAVKNGNTCKIFSRRRNEMSFPAITAALARLPAKSFVLDGEIVALDDLGRPSFQRLQNAAGRAPSLFYYLFDILNLNNHNLKNLPLRKRKQILKAFLSNTGGPLRFSPSLPGDPNALLAQIRQYRLEGLVVKNADSPYLPSSTWVKLKVTCEQEFVIGGYTKPKGGRSYFGALVVGFYKEGQLYFAGKVGTGFDEVTLKMLWDKLRPLEIQQCLFKNLPSPNPRIGGLSASEMRCCTWIEPKLVCQVRYSEWTEEEILRQPVFLGLRDDKKPEEVQKEKSIHAEAD